MYHIYFLVPEGLANWSSITAIAEILSWADDHQEKNGEKRRLVLRVAREGRRHQPAFLPQFHLVDIDHADLIIIPSLSQQYKQVLEDDKYLVPWLAERYNSGTEIASVCTGAFLLAATGLVDNMHCTTHWDAAADLQRMFPKVKLSMDIITHSKGIYTNGGGYSFLNLALFLVEKFFDRRTAIICAKMFQIDIGRSTQSPFAIFQTQKKHGDELVCKAQDYMEAHVGEKISLEQLSQRLSTSRRNFDRRFLKATGSTPLEYIQKLKMELAKNALEDTQKSILEIMLDCGYSDEKAFREVFRKLVGISPLEYKARYHIS